MTKCLYLKGAEGEAEKAIPEQEVIEGGAVKPKEAGLESDLKQPKEGAEAGAGAPPGGVVEPHVQKQAHAGDKAAEANVAAYKEDRHVAAGGESHKQNDLGARGVPLGKKEPQNDQVAQLKDEERSLDKEKEQRAEREKIEKELQERIEKEHLEKERQEKLAREQELEKQRIEKEVQARVEKERLERERREKLAREQEQERIKVKLAEESVQQEIQKADKEILERARKEKELEETRERLAQLEQVIQAKNAGKAAQGAEREDDEALKKGGRDLKEKVAAQADPREGVDNGAVKAEAHPQGSHEKVRDQGEMDLRRKRRAVGPRAAGGPPEETRASRGVPGLEPLLELGGSNLHAALEEQLLAGAMVHSRQIKQTSEDKEVK